jgi:hypothetical protein
MTLLLTAEASLLVDDAFVNGCQVEEAPELQV